MSGKYGFRSGRIHARNLESGSFVISGSAGSLKAKAITFSRKFTNIPKIQLTQWLGSSGTSVYDELITISGGACEVSGATTSGFTAWASIPFDATEDAGNVSGARFSYFAHDFIQK